MRVELRPHQVEGVAKMHNGCILYGDVGVGKTITSLAYYFDRVCNGTINEWGSMETPKDVYVITTAKVRDDKGFELQAAHFGVHADPSLSTNGVRITVDSWNNLHKYVEVKDAFFIFDEQRVVGYGAWSRAFIKVAKHNEWVLLSATPGDTWLDYIPVFIANGWYKHKTDFIDQHVIWTPRVKYPKVLRYQDVGVLVRRRNEVLVHMPYERHTKRHHVDIWCDYDVDAFDKAVKRKWHVFEQRPLRDVAELFGVMRKIVNSDASRISEVRGLMTKHPKLIVFYNFDYELEALRTLGTPSTESECAEGGTATSASPKDATEKLAPWEQPGIKGVWMDGKFFPTLQTASAGTRATHAQPSRDATTTDANWEYLLSPEGMAANQSPLLEKPLKQRLVSSSKTTSGPGSSTQDVEDSGTKSSSSESGGSTSALAVAEWNGHNHQPIPKTDRWLYLVQYRAGAEGWNCVETDAICFYSQTYSYRDWFQAHGRIDRLNTPFTDLWYYHLISRSIIDKAIRAALKVKKSFNEKDLKLGVAA